MLSKSLSFNFLSKRSSVIFRGFSDSITYSGGQASAGQGGFYGSGGSRATGNIPVQKPGALAQQADIQELSRIMKEVEHLDNEIISLGTVVNARSIEVKARRKKLICNPNVAALLDRLEMKGQPVWGLSSAERDMVREARSKYISS